MSVAHGPSAPSDHEPNGWLEWFTAVVCGSPLLILGLGNLLSVIEGVWERKPSMVPWSLAGGLAMCVVGMMVITAFDQFLLRARKLKWRPHPRLTAVFVGSVVLAAIYHQFSPPRGLLLGIGFLSSCAGFAVFLSLGLMIIAAEKLGCMDRVNCILRNILRFSICGPLLLFGATIWTVAGIAFHHLGVKDVARFFPH